MATKRKSVRSGKTSGAEALRRARAEAAAARKEAAALRKQLAASASVLKVISTSPDDIQPVLDAIVRTGQRLFGAEHTSIVLKKGDHIELRASAGLDGAKLKALQASYPRPIDHKSVATTFVAFGRIEHYVDITAAGMPAYTRKTGRETGLHGWLGVPLLRKGESIGGLIFARSERGLFSDDQVALARTFADQAVIAIENVRLFTELQQKNEALATAHAQVTKALAHQTATSEILRVISGSPTDVQPAFDAIAESAARLTGAVAATLYEYDGQLVHLRAQSAPTYRHADRFRALFPRPLAPDYAAGRVIIERSVLHVADLLTDPATPPATREWAQWLEIRGVLWVPLLREGEPIGVIGVVRAEAGRFSDDQVKLLETFAAQAVIAIENVRLFNETREALEHQTATAEVLQVISGSMADATPVFDKILASCRGLFGNSIVTLGLVGDDGMVHVHQEAHMFEHPDEQVRRGTQAVKAAHPRPSRDSMYGYVAYKRQVMHFPDVERGPGVPDGLRKSVELVGSNYSAVYAPLLWEGRGVGALNVSRFPPTPFSDKEIRLLKTFADQAVIAIQNARLFNETKEALERQTATAEILQVIGSSPTDTQPVFDAIVNSGVRLFPGAMITVARLDGETVQAAAIAHEDTTMVAGWRERFTTPLSRDRLHAAAILDAKLIDLPDAEAEKDGPLGPGVRNFLLSGNRAVTIMPMLRGRDAIGAISVTRAVPGPLSDKQIAILRTFADQAVIAIENVRLFNELEARNREVGEALERQTATAEILKVISESPTDTQPVFDAIAASARKLFGDAEVGITIIRGDAIELVAAAGMSEKRLGALRASFPRPLDLVSTVNTTVVDGRLIHYPDMLAEDVPAYTRDTVKSAGIRAMLGVPLLREGRSIGGVFLSRATPGAYTEQQIALLQTFADQAVIAIENVRLFNETKEALERQTATAEVLKVISESPTDVQPVFDAIATKALQLCAGDQGALFTFDGSMIHIGSLKVMSEEGADVLRAGFPMPPGRASASARAILTREVVHITDVYQDPDYLISDMAKAGNWRSIVSAPMLREGHPIGTITVARLRIQPFSDAEIALLRTFADQAVIAIENVRLFNETKEALERQTATSEILKVIASSPSDVQPVFDAIVKGAGRLSYPASVAISILEGEQLHLNSIHVGDSSTGGELAVARAIYPIPFDPERAPSARAILERRVIEIHDATQPDTPEFTRKAALAGHFLSATFVPLIREGRGIGSIIITHPEAGFRLSDKQLALMQTFADQAVIAIENVRLFNETREALERQTATAEILKVISESPTDVQPVFDAIARSAGRLFNCKAGISVREGDGVDLKAIADGSATEEEVKARFKEMKKAFPVPFDPERNLVSRAMATATAIEVADTEDAEAVSRIVRELGRAGGFRSIVNVPLVREGTGIGAIGLAFEQPGMRLNDRQRALVQTFADQAVIAIENVRLFKELEARNREVTETLERQTATAEILKVISESPTDIAPVFRTILANATTLSGSQFATLWMYEGGDAFRAVALHGTPPELTKWLMQGVHRFGPPFFRPEGPWRTGQVADVRDTVPYRRGDEIWIKCVELAHMRTMLMVPLIRDKRLLASIAIYRTEARPFTDQQIGLVSTFADQAVIAIENVRLFNETREALERQTATAEILKVISSSPTDMQPVFDAIVQSCVRLFGGITVALNIVRGDAIDRVAFSESPEARAATSGAFPMPLDDESLAGRAMLSGELLHVPDLSTESWIGERPRSIFRRMGYRSALCAPMIRERQAIGSIVVFRDFTGRFKDEQVALLKTFADQAVIAIENVRLFKELEERTNALTKSVGQLTALGEVSQTISSTLDLEKVLPTIVSRAVQLTGLDGGAIYEYDEEREVFNVRGGQNVRQELVELEREEPIRLGDGPIGRSAQMRQPVQAPDLTAGRRRTRGRDVLLQSGARALLAVPLLREGHILGALAVTRNTPGEFAPEVIALLETFAAQSAIAIQNARLFREIEQKSRELELASQHKSQFLASMSHELRTPLNAILGFNELILGGIYGEVPEDMNAPLAQMQSSGRHLLGLINNVLDLAKIEANRMELALADYSVHDVVGMVRSTLQSLATEKGLEFVVSAQEDLPLAHGDGGRLSQCLINLAGNAIKFTKQGRIEIRAELEGATFRFSVADTGMGIAPDKIDSLFTEFKQTDAAIASEYGGTGLGLAITKKFIEMHGGRIWVESELGEGSTFIFEIPLRVDTGAAA